MFISFQGDMVGQQHYYAKRSWILDPKSGQTHKFKDGSIVVIAQAVNRKTKMEDVMFKRFVIPSLLAFLCCLSTAAAEGPPEPVRKTLPIEIRRQLIHERAMREAEARRMRLRVQRNARYYYPRPLPQYRTQRYYYRYNYRYYRQQFFYPRSSGIYFHFRF